jgi:hypothetical protein
MSLFWVIFVKFLSFVFFVSRDDAVRRRVTFIDFEWFLSSFITQWRNMIEFEMRLIDWETVTVRSVFDYLLLRYTPMVNERANWTFCTTSCYFQETIFSLYFESFSSFVESSSVSSFIAYASVSSSFSFRFNLFKYDRVRNETECLRRRWLIVFLILDDQCTSMIIAIVVYTNTRKIKVADTSQFTVFRTL